MPWWSRRGKQRSLTSTVTGRGGTAHSSSFPISSASASSLSALWHQLPSELSPGPEVMLVVSHLWDPREHGPQTCATETQCGRSDQEILSLSFCCGCLCDCSCGSALKINMRPHSTACVHACSQGLTHTHFPMAVTSSHTHTRSGGKCHQLAMNNQECNMCLIILCDWMK